MEDSTQPEASAHFPEYNILGAELTTFVLQPGFVEGIETEPLSFSNLVDAYRHLFRNNKEYAVLLWNGIPIRLSYHEDIPYGVEGLIEFLERLIAGKNEASLLFKSENLEATIRANQDGKNLTLELSCNKVSGNYQAALSPVSLLKIERDAFLGEWKIVIDQLTRSMIQSGYSLSSVNDNKIIKRLIAFNDRISQRGMLYR